MASRRMFSGQKIETDKFLDLDPRTQALQFHLILNADDDGFVAKPRAIVRMCGCNLEDLKALIANDYLIQFDSGVVVIKDWKVHNFIRKDRYHPSLLPERDLICWTKKGEYLLKEEVGQAYDPETGEMGYPEGYIHYFDEDEEKAKAEGRKPACPGMLDEKQEELPHESPVDDSSTDLEEDYPDDLEDDFDDQDEADDDCGFIIVPEDNSSSPTQATPEAPSSLSALRSSLSQDSPADSSSLFALRSSLSQDSPADSSSLNPGSHMVANRVPEVRAIARDRGYSQRHSKKPLHHYCDRTPEPQYCTTGIGESDSAVSVFSNSTARG